MLLMLLSGSQARQGDQMLTAPERGYALEAEARAFDLSGPARPFDLAAEARGFELIGPERDYFLTAEED